MRRVVVVVVIAGDARMATSLQAAVAGDEVSLFVLPVVERAWLLLMMMLMLLLRRGARRAAVVAQEHGLGAVRDAGGVHGDGGCESSGSGCCHAEM